MAVKFSEFVTATTTTTNTRLVGFDGAAGSQANKQLSLSLTGIYSTNGALSANRTVTMNSKSLTFVGGSLNLIPIQSGTAFEIKNNPSIGSPVSMLKVDDSGLFYIGKGAVATSAGDVVIGELASVTESTEGNPSIAIGKNAFVETTDAVAIGNDSKVYGAGAISIGSFSQSTPANSITLNASGVSATNAITKSFKVFMTDGTTPDFDVVAGGESTLNTSLKITGQAYTKLNAQASGNLTFNWNDGNIQSTTGLTGSPTFTATNPKAGATYIITLTQTGPVTATWTGVKWPGGTAPTLSGANKTDVITLICYDATGAGLYYGAATLDLS